MMNQKNTHKILSKQLPIIILTALISITLFQYLKHLIAPEMTIWESHIITILFGTIVTGIAAYFVLYTYGKKTQLLCREIIYRKQVEAALKLNEERLEALLNLARMEIESGNKITDFALEEAVRLTKSGGGYLHFFNEDEQTIQLYSWSKDVLKTCSAKPDHHYPLDAAGVWADSIRLRKAVIHNNYQSLADKKGYPEGHFHLMRHLGIPIFDGDRIVGVTGVGNKEDPYDESDARQITLFMNSMWGILKQRRSEQERERLILELKDYLAKVKTLSGLLPICANCKKIRDDKGYWKQIEAYISEHSEAEFTHGICPECAKKLYPGYKVKSEDGK
jgi:hypothetical protein